MLSLSLIILYRMWAGRKNSFMCKKKKLPVENQLNRYLSWCKDIRNLTHRTIECKRKALKALIKDTNITDVSELTNAKLEWWIKARLNRTVKYTSKDTCKKKICSTTTVRGYVSQATAWLKWCRDMNYCVKVNINLIVRPKLAPCRRKWYTAEEVTRVLDCCEYLVDEVAIRLLFDTGFRISELLNMRIADIHGNNIFTIGKGNKEGWVYISDETKQRLNLWIKESGAVNYVWIKCTKREYHTKYTSTGMRYRLAVAFKKAGFEGFQPHELRHSFATDLRRRGADIDEIQKLMRHTSLSSTQRYLHNLDGDLDKVWAKFKNYEIFYNTDKRPRLF